MMISVLGCGWLGLPLAVELVRSGYTVKGSTRSASRSSELSSAGIEPFVVDISDLGKDTAGLSKFLSSDILVINTPSKDVEGHVELARSISDSKTSKLLFVSSISVYQNTNELITEEACTLIPGHPLLLIEDIFRSCKLSDTTVLRLGGLYGYDRQPGKFYPPGKIISDPDGPVNMIHRDDCVKIIEKIINHDVWGDTFNCCADEHPSRREFFTAAARAIGSEPPVFEKADTPNFKIVSSEKIKERLNYSFMRSGIGLDR